MDATETPDVDSSCSFAFAAPIGGSKVDCDDINILTQRLDLIMTDADDTDFSKGLNATTDDETNTGGDWSEGGAEIDERDRVLGGFDGHSEGDFTIYNDQDGDTLVECCDFDSRDVSDSESDKENIPPADAKSPHLYPSGFMCADGSDDVYHGDTEKRSKSLRRRVRSAVGRQRFNQQVIGRARVLRLLRERRRPLGARRPLVVDTVRVRRYLEAVVAGSSTIIR
ncbi:hypothetical protein OPT61_g6777 [Boeremia exigua]|uniref:Uncharacterized protein n=1 Tax=Boeremia exigua TaxID=749465 RepID=A0ACC2I5D5_9PLEO|nr:hypothetical protein OPT61_g6777 [Boeremia exigua]